MNMMILRMRLIQSKVQEALRVFDTILGPISVQPGCRHFKLWIDVKCDNEFILFEQWDSFEHLKRHICSADFRGILAVMDMAVERPSMRFYSVSAVSDFDLVVKLRDDEQDLSKTLIEE